MEQYIQIIERAYDLSLISHAIPSIVVVFRWKYFNFPLKITAINAVRTLLITALAYYFSYSNHNNQFFFYLSPCIDIILVSLLFHAIFNFRQEMKWGLALLCVIFVGLMIKDYLTTKTLISSYLTTVEAMFVIIVSILLLRKIVLEYKSSTYKKALIWIVSALLIINLFSILISTLMGIIFAYSSNLLKLSWYLSSPLFIVITNLMVAYGFYIIRHKVKN